MNRLIGICGREGAGKSTIESWLAARADYTLITLTAEQIPAYITTVLHGSPQPELYNEYLALWRKTIDSRYEYPATAVVPQPIPVTGARYEACSFADPLKPIAAAVFDLPYPTLLGLTPAARAEREQIVTRAYDVCGVLTGRRALEYMGTEIFRQTVSENFWVDTFRRVAAPRLAAGARILVADMRFANEFAALRELGAIKILVYRDPQELILTEEDRKTHPAKWEFLTFPRDELVLLHNAGTREELWAAVDALLTES